MYVSLKKTGVKKFYKYFSASFGEEVFGKFVSKLVSNLLVISGQQISVLSSLNIVAIDPIDNQYFIRIECLLQYKLENECIRKGC